jgi:hypothetical protein
MRLIFKKIILSVYTKDMSIHENTLDNENNVDHLNENNVDHLNENNVDHLNGHLMQAIHLNSHLNETIEKLEEQFFDDLTNINNNFILKCNKIQNTTLDKNVISSKIDNSEIVNDDEELNKKYIMLLNFENDTFIPVINIDKKYLEIIENLYIACDSIVDIEKTDIVIPDYISYNDIEKSFFNVFDINLKNNFTENLPLVILKITLEKKIDYNMCNMNKIRDKTCYIDNLTKDINVIDKFGKFSFELIDDNFLSEKKVNKNIIKKINNISTRELTETEGNIERYNNLMVKHKIKIPEIFEKINETYNVPIALYNFENNYKFVPTSPSPSPSPSAFDKISTGNTLSRDLNSIVNSTQDDYSPYNNDNLNFINTTEKLSNNYNNNDDNNSGYSSFTTLKSNNHYRKKLLVLLNYYTLKTVIVEYSVDYEIIVTQFIEFGFIKLVLINISNNESEILINNLYNNIQFDSIEEINKKLLITAEYISLYTKLNSDNVNNEENQIQEFIKLNYEINNNIEDKIKFTDIFNLIINSSIIDLDKTKLGGLYNRLSEYLKKIGLKKKRYSDGYYYYGLAKKLFSKGFIDLDKYNSDILKYKNANIMKERNDNSKNTVTPIFNVTSSVASDYLTFRSHPLNKPKYFKHPLYLDEI